MSGTAKGIVVRLPDEMRAKLDALAQSRGRSLNYVMNEAVRRYLDEEAWLLDEIGAAIQEADATDAIFVPQAEVMAGLGVVIEQARLNCVS